MAYTTQQNKQDAMKMDYMLKAMELQSKAELEKQKSLQKDTKVDASLLSQYRLMMNSELGGLYKDLKENRINDKDYKRKFLDISTKWNEKMSTLDPNFDDEDV